MRAVVLAGCVALAWAAAADEKPYLTHAQRDVRVTMRDGVRLATDVYLPAQDANPSPAKFAAILQRTPYGKQNDASGLSQRGPWLEAFVSHGYAVVIQDVRGRFGSEGRWRPHYDDGADGFDTAKWIGEQPWFSGKLGTVGSSYAGGTQHALAIARAPHLTAMVPVDAMSNCGRYGVRHHGAFELRFFNWVMTLGNPWRGVTDSPLESFFPTTDPAVRERLAGLTARVQELVRALPLRPGATDLSLAPDYERWLVEAMSHGDNDAFWKDMGQSVVDHVAEYADVPVLHVTGWYDSWGTSVANLNYVELSKAKQSPQRLLVGPWTHGGQPRSFAGEAEFGPDAAVDMNAVRLRWFDRWLRDAPNGVERDAPVRIFVMGGGDGHRTPEGRILVGGRWRDEREWPLARAVPTRYYLHADRTLSPDEPAASEPSRYRYDPRHPVPTLGGNLSSQGALASAGAFDQRCSAARWTCEDARPLAARGDVLVFQTPPLERDVEVTGPIVVRLFASSSATDTDFTAKLVDVWPSSAEFPDGMALNVADGIVRARYRASFERAELMQPGTVYAFEIETYPTSLVFARGHRIRLDVSSSNFPRFDPNPNTGEALNGHTRTEIAENRLFHAPEHASHVVLPIVPAP